MTVLLCPLCSEPRFHNVESLRLSLINAATQSIVCPTCSEVLIGLDKLTIHLFTHATKQAFNTNPTVDLHFPKLELQDSNAKPEKYTPNGCFWQSFYATDLFQIQKKEDEHLENNQLKDKKKIMVESKLENSAQCTINLEDLSHLTALNNGNNNNNNNIKSYQFSEAKTSTSSGEQNFVQNCNIDEEVNTELSEYMSELLNKKMPILNFVFPTNTTENYAFDDFSSFLEEQKSDPPSSDYALQNSVPLFKDRESINFAEEEKEKIKNSEIFKRTDVCENMNSPMDQAFLKDFSFPLYKCHLCSKAFKIKGSLSLHYRVAHLGIFSSNDESCATEVEEKNFQCSSCVKSFNTKGKVNKPHGDTVTLNNKNSKSNLENGVLTSLGTFSVKKEQHLQQHTKTHEGKQWHCETCNKYFTTKYFLKKHRRLHTGEMPYACQTCNKTFTFQQSYYKHLFYHSDEKPYPCSNCGRAFKELSTLHNHQRIHSGEKPFVCETCGKRFRQRVSYIVHQRIHTGVLPYQCQICEKKFRYKVSLRSHKCLGQPPATIFRQPDEIVQPI